MSKILIFGASGFIGKALTLKLVTEHKIVAFSNNPANELHNVKNIQTIIGSFTEISDFTELLSGIDCVVHLISTTAPSDNTKHIPDEIVNNIVPTVRLLEDMVSCGVKRIVFASSAGAIYGETGTLVNNIESPPNPYCSYGVQKAAIEMYLKFYGVRYGLDYRIMRISNPYGVGQNPEKMQGLIPILVRRLIDNKEISVFGDGKNMRDYIFLPELIEGIGSVLKYKGTQRIFNLGFGTYYSIYEVIKMIEEVGNKRFVAINTLNSRFCDVKQSYVDMNQCHLELNWFPKIGLKEGIALTLEAFCER